MRPQPPVVAFPGGHVQIVNPRLPIEGVWSDVLHLEPKRELPAHVHGETSSLLICVSGSGEIGIDGKRTRLRKGVCAFIPKGSEHFVKAGRNSALTCLSINEGIIKPGSGADIRFKRKPANSGSPWPGFIAECARTAAAFQKQLKQKKGAWNVFALDL
jgi:mannose-6-phosphate isomerase-like protein (cupin superfamily)